MPKKTDGGSEIVKIDRVAEMQLNLQSSISYWLENNPCIGSGDLRASVTLEALQRTETQDYWRICGKKLGRAEVMELIIDMTSQGYSITQILRAPGMPKHRTYMSWYKDYKPFAETMDLAEQARGEVLTGEALEILDGSEDPKQGFRDAKRAELRLKLAEALNSKKYGKKQQIDVTHHMSDLSTPEVWSRLESFLISNATLINANLRRVHVDVVAQEAEIVSVETEEFHVEQSDLPTLSEGKEGDWGDDIDFGL